VHSLPYFVIPQIFSIAFPSFLYSSQKGRWLHFYTLMEEKDCQLFAFINSCFKSFSGKKTQNTKGKKNLPKKQTTAIFPRWKAQPHKAT